MGRSTRWIAGAVGAFGVACSFASLDGFTGGNTPAIGEDALRDAGGGTPDAEDGGFTCNDTLSDPLNCGRCGHNCLGDSCREGACLPTQIATLSTPGRGIDVDATSVYFATQSIDSGPGGQLLKTSKDIPGTPVVLLDLPDVGSGQGWAPMDVRVDGSYVAASNTRSSFTPSAAVYRVNVAGGIPVPLGGCTPSARGVAFDDAYAYFGGANEVRRAPKGATGCGTTLVSGLEGPSLQFAVDDTTLYFTMATGTKGLRAMPKGGGTPAAAVAPAEITAAYAVVIDGLQLVVSTLAGQIVRLNKDGSNLTVLASNQAGPRGVAVDSANVYWASETSGEIWSVARAGGTPALLALNQAGAGFIAMDAGRLYWTTATGVMRLAK